MSPRYDALIVGAGPAGSSLALRLGRAGRTCLLVDGAQFPRDKVCGEGLMPAGLEVLGELGLRETLEKEGEPFYGIRYRLPDGTTAEADFPDGVHALGLRRRVLDATLLAACEAESNVHVRLGVWVRDLTPPTPGASSVCARVGDEDVEAAVLIGADGCQSTVRAAWGLTPKSPRRARFGVRAHFESDAIQRVVEVYVGGDHELYQSAVGPNLTCVALLLDKDGLAPLQGRLEDGLRDLLRRAAPAGGAYAALAEAPLTGRVAALGPLGLSPRVAHGERLLLVGDAGGALDPITGEGVALSLVTGGIAASVLEDCFQRNAFAVADLKAWTQRRRVAVRALAGFTQAVLHLSRHPARAERAVRNLARSPETFERLLGVASGLRPLTSLRLRDGVALALGV